MGDTFQIFSAAFKSFYYKNTYLPPVDLSHQALSTHLIEAESKAAVIFAKKQLSDPKIKKKLDDGKQVEGRNWVLQSGRTQIPSLDMPYNSSEFSIPTVQDNLFQLMMASRVTAIVKREGLPVVIPHFHLVAHSDKKNAVDPTERYSIFSSRTHMENVPSKEDTIKFIANMSPQAQTLLGRDLATLIEETGLINASFDTIRLTEKSSQIALVNLKPYGLMRMKKPGLWNKLFPAKGHSLEKATRLGLSILLKSLSNVPVDPNTRDPRQAILDQNLIDPADLPCIPGLEAIRTVIKERYQKVACPKLSKWKIALSILTVGLLPLINAIVAIVKARLIIRTTSQLSEMEPEINRFNAMDEIPSEEFANYDRLLEKIASLTERHRKLLEGIPMPVMKGSELSISL